MKNTHQPDWHKNVKRLMFGVKPMERSTVYCSGWCKKLDPLTKSQLAYSMRVFGRPLDFSCQAVQRAKDKVKVNNGTGVN